MPVDAGALGLGYQWPELGVVEAVAEAETLGSGHQALQHGVMQGPLDHQARAGRADLTGVGRQRLQRAGDGRLEIGIGEHDDRRLATELQRHGGHGLRGRRHHQAAGLERSGEGDMGDPGVAGQRRARRLAEAGNDVADTGRQAGLVQQLGQGQGRQRRLLGRLDHGRVAAGERRRESPRAAIGKGTFQGTMWAVTPTG